MGGQGFKVSGNNDRSLAILIGMFPVFFSIQVND